MKKLQSSIPGLIYPSGRDHFFQTCFGFLEGRRKDDGAEGLWRVHDNLYNLETFIQNHPGGSEWISLTRGTDITEAFEVHHLSNRAEQLLPKFFVRKANSPRSIPFTFKPDGFYRKFKERVYEVLKDVDYHHPSSHSKLFADLFITTTILSAIVAVIYKSWIVAVFSAVFLAWTTLVSHNFFHQRDNFRMYYFDLSLMSSKEWRISHALSHHMYTNTLWDMELYLVEPFLQYLPTDQSLLRRLFSVMVFPIVCSFTFTGQAVKRYYSVIWEWQKFEFRDGIPFILPFIMSLVASSTFEAVKIWLFMIILSSFIFAYVGLNAAHHHPDIFHDGDICRKDLDWGLMVMDAVRDRNVIDDSLFLILTNFGSHGLHHLLPMIDHAYLKLAVPVYRKICQEYGVNFDKFSQWELIKGQYLQLIRNKPRTNFDDSKNRTM